MASKKVCNPAHDARVNLFEMSRQQARCGIDLLPSNLGEALDELERDDVFVHALGQTTPKLLKTNVPSGMSTRTCWPKASPPGSGRSI
jgi:hypothetical protein